MRDDGPSARRRNLIRRMNRAIATAMNDDETKPHTELRERHNQRVQAMMDARDALEIIHTTYESLQGK